MIVALNSSGYGEPVEKVRKSLGGGKHAICPHLLMKEPK